MVMSRGTEKKGKAQFFSGKRKGDVSKDEDKMNRNVKQIGMKAAKSSVKAEKHDKGRGRKPNGCMK